MIHGETVTIIRREQHGFKPEGEPDWRHLPEENVDDVLVAPGTQSNATDPLHPDGVTVALTCYLPRAWEYQSLRGALMRVRGVEYAVIGDPTPYDGGLTPTRWNLAVELETARG